MPDENAKPAFDGEKNGDNPEGEDKPSDERELLMGDMAGLETLKLVDGSRLEVEVYFSLEVSVDGRGGGYQINVEVGPEETMDTIENSVFFFKMFRQRGFQLFSPDLDRVYSDDELQKTLFRDSNLKNNSKLILRQPPKAKKVNNSDDENESIVDDMMEEGHEGGEDEIEDMDEEGEIEMDEAPVGFVDAEDPEAQDGPDDKGDEENESPDAKDAAIGGEADVANPECDAQDEQSPTEKNDAEPNVHAANGANGDNNKEEE